MSSRTTRAFNLYLPSGLRRVPKINGADTEVGNLIHGPSTSGRTGPEAARRLLRAFSGFPRRSNDRDYDASWRNEVGAWSTPGGSAQDWGRQFFPNGSCCYIDLDHLEFCLPEVWSAEDHAACYHALLRDLRVAMNSANERIAPGRTIEVLLNNSDGQSHSYGSHLNFLVTRRAWDNIFCTRLHYLMFLASYQVSSILFTGQGKLGSENGAEPIRFGLSQRADFVERLVAQETTHTRPIVNSRNETLCGASQAFSEQPTLGADLARLHVIFFDTNLCHAALLLKVGVMQIILAMIEAECTDPALLLDDPLAALRVWNADPQLRARARLASGEQLTALELQLRFLEAAAQFVEAGGCEGIVPEAERIMALWHDTLCKLEAGNFDALFGRLDWVTKQTAIQSAVDEYAGVSWESPEAKTLDLVYGSLDPDAGIYWGYEADDPGMRLIADDRIEQFRREPPEDTRAYTRGKLLASAAPEDISDVDWHAIKVWERGTYAWARLRTVSLGDPARFTKAETGHLFDGCTRFTAILDELDAINEGVVFS